MKKVFKRPGILKDVPFHYCPGCTHGVAHRLVAEVIEELGIRDTAIGVAPVGCSVFAMDYFEIDMFQASHGRAPAVATGIKRVLPDRVVFTYQGDGDLAAIGTGEFVHAATRGERITAVFINNAIYGMTGGQMAPTTIMGQVTKTTPFGRDREINGFPIRVCEMLAPLEGTAYLARVAVHTQRRLSRPKSSSRGPSKSSLKGWGSPWWRCFPPARPTGDFHHWKR